MSKKFDPISDYQTIDPGALIIAKIVGHMWSAALFEC